VIELVLPYPISANRYWASRVIRSKATGKQMAMTYVTPEAKHYREQVAWLARSAGVRKPISGRVRLHAELYPHRPLDWQARMRKFGECWDDTVQCIDLGNAEKVMSDALQGIVIADDCMFRRIVLDRMEPDARGARLLVRVEAIELERPQVELLPALPDEAPAEAEEGAF
jgi:crossover junction endodeoxyribonuclease RusA